MSRRIREYERDGARWEDAFDEEGGGGTTRPRRMPKLEVLLDDPRFTVVNKPDGMPTIPERFDRTRRTVVDELWSIWKRTDPAAPKPVVCHRLDRDTSGCLVLAKDPATASEIMAAFRQREVRKAYLAIVTGAPQPPGGAVTLRVAPDRSRAGSMKVVEKGGKPCESTYETLETFRGVSLVRVRPSTGRTHEVRLALRSLGTPCAVDPLYGGEEALLLSRWKRGYRTGRGRAEVPLIDRLTLHAETLDFPRPGDPTQRVCVEAPLPRDFATTLRQLRRHAAPGSL